ncbi:MAG: phosphatase [Acidimicrobiales bacterium]|nr:MAG: phosphatase [Acidimicrobiales bacterium]
MATHLIWDWNGTLLNDADAVLEATNDALAQFHLGAAGAISGLKEKQISPVVGPLTVTEYRAAFTRPLQRFYANIFGREITEDEFVQLEQLFHAAYLKRCAPSVLNQGARGVLGSWQQAGCTQSLLSLWPNDELLTLAAQLELTDFFIRIDGRRGLNAGCKAAPLRQHLAALAAQTIEAEHVVLIGDALDDAAAATAAGVRCVLFAGGAHEVAELVATGHPVAHTLAQAVAIASDPHCSACSAADIAAR